MGALPPVFIEFLGKTTGVKTAIAGVETELATVDAQGAGAFAKTGMLGKAAILGLGVAAAETAKKTVEMAGDFQQQMTRVRTGAGEAAANMKTVSNGVLAMAGQVGQGTAELTQGLYTIESASYHGTDALNVLRVAAEGAKVGNADLQTTTDAVTTAMNAYKTGAGSATQVMNALIGTEAEGKTNLEDLAGSMASILPTSAAAKVGLNEVLGAMATMTAQGTPARVAATYLRQTIGMLSNPSAKAADEMKNLGLNAVQVGQELGTKGLAATLTTLTDAIQSHMGPAGTVVIQKLQGAAGSATAFQKVLADLPASQQTYIGALATMVGGTKSMMGALQLTGPHMADFQKNTAGIAEHVKAGGKEIEGWADVQKNFNQKVAQAKASLEALGIQIGQVLMPYVQGIIGVLATATAWLTRHHSAAVAAAVVIGGVLVFALAAATAALYSMAAAAAVNPVTWIVLGVMALVAAVVLLAMHWRQVWDGIRIITAAAVGMILLAWDAVAGATVAVWSAISGAVMSAWHAIAAFFASAWHAVADPIVAGWRWVSSATSTVWNGITAFFRRWWPLLLVIFLPPVAALLAIWNRWHAQILGTVHTVWNGITGFFAAVWNGIVASARAVWSVIRAVIIAPMTAVWKGLQSLWHTVSAWLAAAWHAIAGTASSIWASIRDRMTGPLTSAWHTITTTVARIKSAISSGLTSAYNAVSGIGTKFLQIGKAIVDGIVKGVVNSGGALKSELGHLANSALSSAKGFLGIGSPSREFADQVGRWIPAGIAQGVTDNAAVAHRAVGSLAAALPGAAGAAGVGVSALSLGTAAYGGARIISQTVHVTVQGSVLTSGQQLVDVVQAGFLQMGARNPQTYPAFAR
ncbi:phage tail tape measure protein [Actinacidiphila reveromycinica]|uniref:phage tail tape measure protein n=1 Tax=Actinacidiphila reveromycinica TaxID=659352 RepID=UPI0019224006|nr:phage tail tape measure protein [Streptomyces sp. SN-593]